MLATTLVPKPRRVGRLSRGPPEVGFGRLAEAPAPTYVNSLRKQRAMAQARPMPRGGRNDSHGADAGRPDRGVPADRPAVPAGDGRDRGSAPLAVSGAGRPDRRA